MTALTLLHTRWLALSRRQRLLWFGGLLAVLLLSILLTALLRAQVARASTQVQHAQQALQQVADLAQTQQLQATLAAATRTLLDDAARHDIRAGQWGERRLNIRQANLRRDEINNVLRDITVNESRLFQSEEFELSVLRPDEGLFQMPASDNALRLTLRGSVLFRLGDQ